MDKSVPGGYKRCNKCERVKPVDEFYTLKRPNGQRKPKYICKECENAGSQGRFKRGKAQANKKCAYPSCDVIIVPTATYCQTHFRLDPNDIEQRASKLPPKSICSYPGCNKVISHGAMHCIDHFNRRERSQATKSKMSASAKKRVNTPEGKANMSRAASLGGKASIGRHHTPEAKTKIREKRALQVFSEESIRKSADARRGIPSWNKGGSQTEAAKAKISATLQSKRDHLSQKAKERYNRETEEQREKRLKPWIQAGQDNIPTSGTTIELFVAEYLDKLGIEYKTQERIGYYIVDIYIPERKLIINVDGCFWHGCEKCGFNSARHIAKRRSDQKRYHYLVNKGYTVKSIWEHTIRLAMQDSNYVLRLGLE